MGKGQFLKELGWLFELQNSAYENIIVMRDSKMTIDNHNFNEFMEVFTLWCLINTPPCHQSKNPTCIHLILTNKWNLVKLSDSFEIGSIKGTCRKDAGEISILISNIKL